MFPDQCRRSPRGLVPGRRARDRVDAWVSVAEPYYTGDETLIVTQVDAAWDALQIDIGRELRRLA